jgi:hypothetical protein
MTRRVTVELFDPVCTRDHWSNLCWPSLYTLSADHRKGTASRGSFALECASIAEGVCLSGLCLAMAATSGSVITPFRRHITIFISVYEWQNTQTDM